jgi:hypothetical protein
MSVEIKKDITTVTVEVPKTGVAVENAVTNINVQVSQPQLTISQAGVSGRDGTSGTSGFSIDSSSLATTGSNHFSGNQNITGSLNISGSNSTLILPNHSTAPTSPPSGALYFNTTDFHFYGWNGGQWTQLDN